MADLKKAWVTDMPTIPHLAALSLESVEPLPISKRIHVNEYVIPGEPLRHVISLNLMAANELTMIYEAIGSYLDKLAKQESCSK